MREFGELERAIMDVMWAAKSPCATREVRERLRYGRPVAYTTVMTVMDILYRKGVHHRAKCGRAWRVGVGLRAGTAGRMLGGVRGRPR